MNSIIFLGLIGALSCAAGWLAFRALMGAIPYLETKEKLKQKEEILKESASQVESILKQSQDQAKDHLSLLEEEMETHFAERTDNLKIAEDEMALREAFLENEEKRLERLSSGLATKASEFEVLEAQENECKQKIEANLKIKIKALEERAKQDASKIEEKLSHQLIEDRKLETQKVLKSIQEELSSSAKRSAQRALDKALARYEPHFIWPKSNNIIELPDEKLFEEFADEKNPILSQIKEKAEINIQPMKYENGQPGGFIKVAGGFGIFRETAKLTLEELITQPKGQWAKWQPRYDKQLQKLNAEAVQLGRKAVNVLRLEDIHPEIQYLIGSLNWRTSYRQNQWYHTVEVAILAGLLAQEMGENPDDAKRVGLLHDLGKSIDYRIEGSHAVISGDYADRFGEPRYICDTVMSHHSDLLVETPLAYILRAADTLSGGRPGARVNLEEGYQIRIGAIYDAIDSFSGISDVAIMNGGREVHIQVNYKQVKEKDLQTLTKSITKKIEDEVTYPGQIKVLVSRSFEVVSIA